MSPDKDYFDYRITTKISAVAAICLAPFTIYHLLNGNWILFGLTGGLNFSIIAFGYLFYKRRNNRWTRYLLAILGCCASYGVIYEIGTHGVYFSYPLIICIYYILPLRAAFLITAFFSALIGITIYTVYPTVHMPRILISLLFTNAIAYVFSHNATQYQDRLRHLASIDPLTGIGNRRNMDESLNRAVAMHMRYDTPVSLIIIDIDFFKKINDTYGHDVGDNVLIELADIMRKRIRETDNVFRYGGEEFVILTPETELNIAYQLAEELRETIESSTMVPYEKLTISAGVAELKPDESRDEWLKRSDAALYVAKKLGRNNCQLANQA